MTDLNKFKEQLALLLEDSANPNTSIGADGALILDVDKPRFTPRTALDMTPKVFDLHRDMVLDQMTKLGLGITGYAISIATYDPFDGERDISIYVIGTEETRNFIIEAFKTKL